MPEAYECTMPITPSPSNPTSSSGPKIGAARPSWRLAERIERFPILRAMASRVLLCDGAMGTMIQRAHLTPEDFDGKDGCNEILVDTRPEVIEEIHLAYLRVGADIVETNSFGSTPLVLSEYGIAD